MWCSVGTNGEAYDNTCGGGGSPITNNCWTGVGNNTGHCYDGGSVINSGPTARTYCVGGSGGKSSNKDCSTGTKAYGQPGCNVGTNACHCANGTGA